MATKSFTENLSLPIPYGGHVPVLNAIEEGYTIIDREIQALKDGGITPPETDLPPITILAAGASNIYNTLVMPTTITYPDNLRVWDWNNSPNDVGNGFIAPSGDSVSMPLSFAIQQALAHPDRQVFLVNISYGSGTMAQFAETGVGSLGASVRNNAQAAMEDIPGAYRYDYMLWANGEQDALVPEATAAYAANFRTFMNYLTSDTITPVNRDTTKVVIVGIVDAPRAPWRPHTTFGYVNKRIAATSAGRILYVPIGYLQDPIYWQPDVGGTVSPMLSIDGMVSVAASIILSMQGNTTFTAETHGDNDVANVLEVFSGVMFPVVEFGARVPEILHDFQSTMKRYQHRYVDTYVIGGTEGDGAVTYDRRASWQQMVGDQLSVECATVWTAHTGTGGIIIRDFMPFENNTGVDMIFDALMVVPADGGATASRLVKVRWELWTSDLHIVTFDENGMSPVTVPPAAALSFNISVFRT